MRREGEIGVAKVPRFDVQVMMASSVAWDVLAVHEAQHSQDGGGAWVQHAQTTIGAPWAACVMTRTPPLCTVLHAAGSIDARLHLNMVNVSLPVQLKRKTTTRVPNVTHSMHMEHQDLGEPPWLHVLIGIS